MRRRYHWQSPWVTTGSLTWCKLSNTSHFSNDLGLDSLDTVEVVMAIEEVRWFRVRRNSPGLTSVQEFSIEIPDKEADTILSSMFSQWRAGLA